MSVQFGREAEIAELRKRSTAVFRHFHIYPEGFKLKKKNENAFHSI